MSLKILIAGCLPKDRRQIEAVVRNAFGSLSESDPWSVSLVKLGCSWSVTLEGPGPAKQGLSLTAPEDRLRETIAEALRTDGGARTTAAAHPTLEELEATEGLLLETTRSTATTKLAWTTEAPAETKADANAGDRYDCPACGRSFRVVYTARPREAQTQAPVACPHCWQVTQVSVPESARVTEEYRAEAFPN